MKKIASFLPFIILPFFFISCDGDFAKKTASGITKKTVELGKGTLTGIAEGIDEGRKSAESSDDAKIVTRDEELDALLKIEILSVSPVADGTDQANAGSAASIVEFAFSVEGDRPVRISGLTQDNAFMAIDKESFAKPLAGIIPTL